MSDDQVKPVISVSPEPSPEELAAIVAAVTTAMRDRQPAPETATRPPETSRWARAGRLDAIRGIAEPNDRQ